MVRRFLAPFASILLFVCVFVCVVTPVAAQPPDNAESFNPPAHISFVEGTVTLERDGRTDDAPGNMPLLSGDRVRTRAGRAEILFADGSTLHLDRETTLDLQSDELVRLIDGRLRLSIPGPARIVSYRIDAPHAWLQIAEPGEYRASFLRTSNRDELEAAVLRGRADLINEDGRTTLRAGERAFARADAAPSYAYVFNSAAWDAFDRWSEERRNERLGLSTQYLPEEVRPYAGALDRSGAWRYESSYGYVWYPRVDASWRPYYQGRWATLPSYGWTWIGSDPWAWPTHHYGRWGFSSGAWFWIPGRSWAPAWVSWGYAPGYVSWCPLGWNNRPVFQIVTGVNVYRGYDPWRAWTVVPQRHFGNGYVQRAYVAGHQIDSRTRGAFTYRSNAPAVVGYAAPRGASPIRVAGTGSRRSTSPLLTNRGDNSAPRFDSSAGTRTNGSPERGIVGAAVQRATPSRPMVRSEQERSIRNDTDRQSAAPAERAAPQLNDRYRSLDGSRSGTPSRAPIGADRATRPDDRSGATTPDRRVEPATPYRRVDPASPYRRIEPATPYQRVEPRIRERPDTSAAPESRAERRAPDRAPQDRSPDGGSGSYGRRAPSDRPAHSTPSSGSPSTVPARPDRSGPPSSAAPPPSSRSRGEAPSRGTAVRRPGGGR